MLPKRFRLPYPHAQRVKRYGVKIQGEYLVLWYQTRLTAAGSKWSIVIPKKTVKLASARNRYKRVISEALRRTLPSQSIDAVLQLKRPVEEASTRSLTRMLIEFFTKHKII